MASGLDMSLDDIIKNSKPSGRGGGSYRGRGGRAGAGGPDRRFPNRPLNRPAPYSYNPVPVSAPIGPTDLAWGHGLFLDQIGQPTALETGTKLYISNLEYGVTNDDIKELFSEVGDIKQYTIHYDRSGRSKGTAEVVYARRVDALAAVKRYNNVQLDGKPMKIEIVGTNMSMPNVSMPSAGILPQPHVVASPFMNPAAFPRSVQGGGRGFGRGRGGRGFGRGRGGRGRGRVNTQNVSAEDLDAELDKYHEEAMQES